MRDNKTETTYGELQEACMRQNEIHSALHQADADVGQMQAELETLRKLHLLASCRRKLKQIAHLKNAIASNIEAMIESCKEG